MKEDKEEGSGAGECGIPTWVFRDLCVRCSVICVSAHILVARLDFCVSFESFF